MWNSSNYFAATFQLCALAWVFMCVHCSTYALNRVKLRWQQQRNMMLTFTLYDDHALWDLNTRRVSNFVPVILFYFRNKLFIFFDVFKAQWRFLPQQLCSGYFYLRSLPLKGTTWIPRGPPSFDTSTSLTMSLGDGDGWKMERQVGGGGRGEVERRGVPPCGGGDKNNEMKKESTWQQQKSVNK